MEPPGGRESRLNLNAYNMDLVSGGWPSTSLQPSSPRHMSTQGFTHRGMKTDSYDERGLQPQSMALDSIVNEMPEDPYNNQMQPKKSPPSNGKKTKGRVKIKMEYIENKLRRYTTFSKRKTGIMKKAYELSTLTGTQVMLLVASETGHVYTFATRKLQPMITSDAGKALIQTCLNSPDPPAGSASGDQRMSATGFEETELTYNISDEDSKDDNMSAADSSDSSDGEATEEIKEDTPPQTTSTKASLVSHQTSSSLPSSTSSPSPSSTTTTAIAPKAVASSTQPTTLISPLVYQTSQGMMYAQSNGGVIFGLAQADPSLPHGSQLLIPLSVMATATANGQGELDLSSKRK